MFVNVNADRARRPRLVGELSTLSPVQIFLSEYKYCRGAEIFGESEPADYVYQVAEGAVRSYKLLSDGRRQIGAFHLVGDICIRSERFAPGKGCSVHQPALIFWPGPR